MDSSMIALIGTELTGASTDITSLLTTFLPVIMGLTVIGLGVKLAPRFIKRLGRGV